MGDKVKAMFRGFKKIEQVYGGDDYEDDFDDDFELGDKVYDVRGYKAEIQATYTY